MKKTVFITGAATGIGCTAAHKLDQLGWTVFAGVMPGQDTRDLLRVHIQHLRQKLGDSVDAPRIIVTEHGMGYRFVRQDSK